ncbi:MAG: Ig-like domain-containing protein, partial [Bacteroidota bacterium]
MKCGFSCAAQTYAHPFVGASGRYISVSKKSTKTLRFFSSSKLRQLFLFVLVCIALPVISFSQLTGGTISAAACQTYNAAHVVVQTVPISGEDGFQSIVYTWERSTDNFGTAPTIVGGNTTNLSDNYTLTGTTYYRRRVDNAGDFAYSNVVTINPRPQVISITPATPDICFGQTSFPVTITALFNPDEYQILWTAGPVALTDVPFASNNFPVGGAITVQVVPGAPVGTYTGTLTLRVSSTGCTFTGVPASAVVNALPTIGGTLNVCAGLTTSLNGSGTAAAVTPWTSSNTGVATVDNAGVVTGVSAGTTVITYTNNLGCQQTATVTVNALPTIGGTLGVCAGLTTSLNGSGTAAAVTPWTSSNTGVATVDNAGVVTGVSAGTTVITYTNNLGCQQTATVTVNALPTIGGTLGVCAGLTTSLNGSGTAAAVTPWTSSNTGVATVDNAGVVTGVSAGTTVITYTNNLGCQQTATVTVNALPISTITAGSATTFCAGGSVTLIASAGNSWLWNTGETTQSINVSASSNKTVTVTDGNGCSATSSATTVAVNPLPTPTITAGSTTTFCADGSVNLTASAGSSWVWNTGETTQSITVNTSSNKSVTVTDGNGCSAISSATTVTVNALPSATITAGGPTTFCAGGSVTLTAGAGSSWLWNTGETTQSITANTSSNKIVTITNGNGCSATSSATTVVVNPLPTPTIIAGSTTTFCAGGSVNLTASAGNSWLWNTGETTQSITVNTSSSKAVTVTDGNGCSATSSATTVVVNPLPTP